MIGVMVGDEDRFQRAERDPGAGILVGHAHPAVEHIGRAVAQHQVRRHFARAARHRTTAGAEQHQLGAAGILQRGLRLLRAPARPIGLRGTRPDRGGERRRGQQTRQQAARRERADGDDEESGMASLPGIFRLVVGACVARLQRQDIDYSMTAQFCATLAAGTRENREPAEQLLAPPGGQANEFRERLAVHLSGPPCAAPPLPHPHTSPPPRHGARRYSRRSWRGRG